MLTSAEILATKNKDVFDKTSKLSFFHLLLIFLVCIFECFTTFLAIRHKGPTDKSGRQVGKQKPSFTMKSWILESERPTIKQESRTTKTYTNQYKPEDKRNTGKTWGAKQETGNWKCRWTEEEKRKHWDWGRLHNYTRYLKNKVFSSSGLKKIPPTPTEWKHKRGPLRECKSNRWRYKLYCKATSTNQIPAKQSRQAKKTPHIFLSTHKH